MKNNEYTATPDWFGENTSVEQTNTTITTNNNYYSSGSIVSNNTNSFGKVESSVTNDGNAVTSLSVSLDGKTLIYHLDTKFITKQDVGDGFVTIDTDQAITGMKTFTPGLTIGSKLIHEENGVIYLDADLAVKGGVVTHALMNQKPSDIMDGVLVDNVTIIKDPMNNGALKVIASGGSGIGLDTVWAALASDSTNQINGSHLKYVDNNFTKVGHKHVAADIVDLADNYVTLHTKQSITAEKAFEKGIFIGDETFKKKLYYQDGVVYLDGDFVVTGGVVTHALGTQKPSDVMDGVIVDDITIKKIDGKLTSANGSGGLNGVESNTTNNGNAVTSLTYDFTTKKIIYNKDTRFATELWVTDKNYILNVDFDGRVSNKIWKELSLDNPINQIHKSHLKYVDDNFVTLVTTQTISGIKHFSNGLHIGPASSGESGKIYRKDNTTYINGDVAVTGGIVTHALGNKHISTVMDGVYVDNITIKKINNQLVVVGGGDGSFTKLEMWDALYDNTAELINGAHLKYVDINFSKKQHIHNISDIDGLSVKINGYDTHIANYDIHVTASDKIKWDNHVRNSVIHVTSDDKINWNGKADKIYVDDNFVTLTTAQTIVGDKYFNDSLHIGTADSSSKLYRSNGVTYLTGDLAITGGIVTHALGNTSISTIMDGVYVDDTTIKKINNQLVVVGGSGSDFDSTKMWKLLSLPTKEEINKSHIETALNGYATQIWVNQQNFLKTIPAEYATMTWVLDKKYLLTNDIAEYAKKDGSNASGTWNISISGNADSATNATLLGGKLANTYVTVDTNQTIYSQKIFNAGIIINGAAVDRRLLTRGIGGCNSDGTVADDIYVNYNTDYGLKWGKTGQSKLHSNGNVEALSATYWGNVGIGVAPTIDKLSVKGNTTIDGTLTINNNVWARTNISVGDGLIIDGNTHGKIDSDGYSLDLGTDGGITNGVNIGNSASKIRLNNDTIITGNLLVTGGIVCHATNPVQSNTTKSVNTDSVNLLKEELERTKTQMNIIKTELSKVTVTSDLNEMRNIIINLAKQL